jgi:copper transport protein
VLVTLAAAAVAFLGSPSKAAAHSFLIRSQPEAGARLSSAPVQLTLYFSEPFVPSSARVTIRRTSGQAIPLAKPGTVGAVIEQPLPRIQGVFVVNWRVLSDDGHISVGEFAFAAGSTAPIPSVATSAAKTPWEEVLASWLFFAGLALALGGIASERFVWRLPTASATHLHAPVLAGLAFALLAALMELVLLAGGRSGGGFRAGLDPSALGRVVSTRPGTLTLVVLAALACAAALVRARPLRAFALMPLLAAVVVTSLRGHSGTSGHWWATSADVVHLATAALWTGALAHLVLIVGRRRKPLLPVLREAVRRYASAALVTTIILITSGIPVAIAEFRDVGAVWSSGYGQTLLIKAGLVGLALALALGARLRALPANPSLGLGLLRRLTGLEIATLVGVLVAVAFLVNLAPPRGAAASRSPVIGPPPLEGPALRLADLAGQLVVAVAAGHEELQFTIVAPGDKPVEARLTADAERNLRDIDLFPRSCGPGCFVIRYRLQPGETQIVSRIEARGWQGGTASFTIRWPFGPAQDRLLADVAKAMKAVPKLVVNEQVTSGPGASTAATGYSFSGPAFMKTELFGQGALDVRLLRQQAGLRELAFALPASKIWYRMWIDRRNRLQKETILSPGHRIRRTFKYGAAAAAVTTNSRGMGQPATAAERVPPPPARAAVFGREDGDLAVGLAVRPGLPLVLQATVLAPNARGLDGLHVRYLVRGPGELGAADAKACGSGCYRAAIAFPAKPQSVAVQLQGGGRSTSTVRFGMPARWPPPNARGILRRASRVFRKLHRLVIHERLASNAEDVLFTTYRLEAPNRLSYQVRGGPAAIVIGDRRWDRKPDGPWKESQQLPLQQPSPSWTSDTANIHLVATGRVEGRPVWLLSFYDRNGPSFFTIAVERRTLRTLELHLTTAAHFMQHRYSHFNAPFEIMPPEPG